MSLHNLVYVQETLLSSNVITNVWYPVNLIKKGEQLNSLDFMFPSSVLYAEAFLSFFDFKYY